MNSERTMSYAPFMRSGGPVEGFSQIDRKEVADVPSAVSVFSTANSTAFLPDMPRASRQQSSGRSFSGLAAPGVEVRTWSPVRVAGPNGREKKGGGRGGKHTSSPSRSFLPRHKRHSRPAHPLLLTH